MNGFTLMLRPCLMFSSPRSVPASETRVPLKRMGMGAQLLCFVQAPNGPGHVESPFLRRRIGEAQRLERNLVLRDPPSGEPADFDVPHAIPVDVPALRRRWIWPSRLAPPGLVMNMKPDRRS